MPVHKPHYRAFAVGDVGRGRQPLSLPMNLAVSVCALAFAAGCAEDEPDAYGNFEATEVVVSAEAAGQLLRFAADEGEHIPAGVVVGLLDTTDVALELRELAARLDAARAQTGQVQAKASALEAQLELARSELGRTQRLFQDEAATVQRLEQAGFQVEVLQGQLQAALRQGSGTEAQAHALVARMARLRNRLRKSRITNPMAGTVLTAYADAGEFVQLGQPLYEIADLDTLILRAYITGDQLARVRLGQRVQVSVDARDDELRAFPGVVSWIAAEAEFTPTPIQTREERTDLVYAIEVRVPNPDGYLKIGMPGEVRFEPPDGWRGSERAGTGAGSVSGPVSKTMSGLRAGSSAGSSSRPSTRSRSSPRAGAASASDSGSRSSSSSAVGSGSGAIVRPAAGVAPGARAGGPALRLGVGSGPRVASSGKANGRTPLDDSGREGLPSTSTTGQ